MELKDSETVLLLEKFKLLKAVALMNCCDFFAEIGLIGNNTEPKLENSREAFRKYINAIISLDNILDYLYYHSINKKKITFWKYRDSIWNRFSILKKISNYANAFKHCERTGNILETEEIEEETNVNFGLPFNLYLLQEASKLWHKYINDEVEIDYEE